MRLRLLMSTALLLLMTGCVPAAQSGRVPAPSEPAPASNPAPGAQTAPTTPAPAAPAPATTPQGEPPKPVTQTPAPAAGGQKPAEAVQPKPQVNTPVPAQAEPPKAAAGPRLAILVYHDVGDQASGGYTISQRQLEEHIAMLQAEGYAFYRLEDVEKLLAGGQGMPEKGVLLAFDDGYQSYATRVLPVAQKYSVPAVCFYVTKYQNFDIIFGLPHMSNAEIQRVANSGLLQLAGHSYDGHRTAATADGSQQPVLINRIVKPQSTLVETDAEYASRVQNDFEMTAHVLRASGAGVGTRHFTFPYGARSDEAVALGRKAGFQYFYIGTDQLVTPGTDPGAIPRVNAGAPEITAEVLRSRLDYLFAQP